LFVLLILFAAQILSGCTTQSAVPPIPIVTPAITPISSITLAPAPTPTIECVDDAKFISDLSVPDGMHLRPGTVFTKTWQIRNNGKCTWTIDYQLKFIGGATLNEVSVNLSRPVTISGTLELSIVLTAPITAGNYNARWRLFAADGVPFGPTLFAEINVP
jgi:hypothetical protein